MSVGVVVIAAGRHGHLRRMLAALAQQTQQPADVVVVDMDPAHSVAAIAAGRARVITCAAKRAAALPLAAARNAGAAAVDAAAVVFLDVDCIPAPTLVDAYACALRRHREAIACGPVRYLRAGWDADVPADGDIGVDVLESRSEAHSARRVVAPGSIELDDDHEMFWSLSFGVRREVWSRLGGFDERYVGYGAEDTDLAFRARALGVPLAWLGDGVAYHQWHPTTWEADDRAGELVANATTFHRRWGTWPMEGWLRELHERGTVRFEPDRDVLELVAG